MQFMGKDMVEDICTHFLKQRVFRLKMGIERTSAYIRLIQYLLHRYVVKMLLFQ